MTLAEFSLAAFTALNVGRGLAYAPQIVRICRDGNGASAVSIVTWSLFAASHLATVAYAMFYASDVLIAGVFAFNALGCLAIVVLTSWKRLSHGENAIGHARKVPRAEQPAAK